VLVEPGHSVPVDHERALPRAGHLTGVEHRRPPQARARVLDTPARPDHLGEALVPRDEPMRVRRGGARLRGGRGQVIGARLE